MVASSHRPPMIQERKRSATVSHDTWSGIGDADQRVALGRHRERDADAVEEGDVAAVELEIGGAGKAPSPASGLIHRPGWLPAVTTCATAPAEKPPRSSSVRPDRSATTTRPRSKRTRGVAPAGGRSLTAMNGAVGAGAAPAAMSLTVIGAVSGDSALSAVGERPSTCVGRSAAAGRQQDLDAVRPARREIGEVVRARPRP